MSNRLRFMRAGDLIFLSKTRYECLKVKELMNDKTLPMSNLNFKIEIYNSNQAESKRDILKVISLGHRPINMRLCHYNAPNGHGDHFSYNIC